jgi:hypothetical protein
MLENELGIWGTIEEIRKDEAFCIGYVTGRLTNLESTLKRKKFANERTEEIEDLINFRNKYRNLNNEQLAKAIWKESEYWHGSYYQN